MLIAGHGCGAAAEAAAQVAGVKKVRVADAPHYAHQLAENVAALVVSLASGYSHILAPATAAGKISGITFNVTSTTPGATPKAIVIDDVKYNSGDDALTVNRKVAAAINDKMDQSGVYAELNPATGAITLQSIRADQFTSGFVKGTATAATGVTIDPGAVPANQTSADVNVQKVTGTLDISTFLGSQQALEVVDRALTAVSSSRAEMGAIQNRFTSTIANLSTTSENLSASRSRIRDADYAKETAEMTRTQILQQAGTAMLAQANQVPQNVLNLLK